MVVETEPVGPTITRERKQRREPIRVDFDDSTDSDYSIEEEIIEPSPPPKTKRGSVRRQASIKATKSMTGPSKVTRRKKKASVSVEGTAI